MDKDLKVGDIVKYIRSYGEVPELGMITKMNERDVEYNYDTCWVMWFERKRSFINFLDSLTKVQ